MQEFHTRKQFEEINRILLDILQEFYSDPENLALHQGLEKKNLYDLFYQQQPPQQAKPLQTVLTDFRDRLLKQSVRTWHPLFLNQMFSGVPYSAVVGDVLASMMNTTLATWEAAPVATLIERNLSRWMADLVGMPAGSSGIFVNGGSLSNLLALTIARNQKLDSGTGKTGLKNQKQGVVLCSKAAHYSLINAVNLLGIGTQNIIPVETNSRNEMLVDDFADKLSRISGACRCFAAVATIGITVTGGIDPIDAIAEMCRQKDVHLHIDAAFGGSMALSERGKPYFNSMDQIDSLTWDAHKWLYVPLTCSALLVPDAGVLKDTFDSNAHYLFHPGEEVPEFTDDLGRYTIYCGKRFDALKLWIFWHSMGTQNLQKWVDDRLDLTERFYGFLTEHPDFETPYEPVTPVYCFRYLPKAAKALDQKRIDAMHRYIREQIKNRGLAYFNIARLYNKLFFRTILINPLTTMSHLRDLVQMIEDMGQTYLKQIESL